MYRSTRNQDLDELIASLNRMLGGWARYHRYGVSKAIFNAVDSHTWRRLMRWIRAKVPPVRPHPVTSHGPIG
jgi:RNA-directed DNA polymerase